MGRRKNEADFYFCFILFIYSILINRLHLVEMSAIHQQQCFNIQTK